MPMNRKLSISDQCRLLNLNRSTYYYKKKPVKPEDLKLMRLIDEQYLKDPQLGQPLDAKPSAPAGL